MQTIKNVPSCLSKKYQLMILKIWYDLPAPIREILSLVNVKVINGTDTHRL